MIIVDDDGNQEEFSSFFALTHKDGNTESFVEDTELEPGAREGFLVEGLRLIADLAAAMYLVPEEDHEQQ